MWRLHQGDQQSGSNRTDIGNPAEQLRRAMLAALRQKIAPCFLAQLLQPIQLLIEQLGPAPNAWFSDLAQPFLAMTRCVNRGTTAGNTPASVQLFYPVHDAREILADRQVTAAQLLQRSESGLAMIDRRQKSYKRECQETFFSDRLRRRMLSCIQPPAPSNAHVQRLIVLDLAEQQRGIGFRFPAVSCL